MDSSVTLSNPFPIPMEDNLLQNIVRDAKDFALLNGAGMRYKDTYNPEILEMAPFFLFPSIFPRRDFELTTEMQPHINLLMHNIAHDYEFLKRCLERTIKVDDFTARLWNIYETVRAEGIVQSVCFGAFRSDYFICENGDYPKQVEVNTVAASFGALALTVKGLHKYVLSSLGKHELLKNLPENRALQELCNGIVISRDIYKDMFNAPSSVILFLVEDVTYNICDQRYHEYQIRNCRPDVQIIRRTLTEIYQRGKLTDDKTLIIDDYEVAVVYFRAGYEPDQYPSENEWKARLTIERSKAIKCPSIYYHLAGAKKVQQEMARPGVVERYLPPEIAKKLKFFFTGLYSLDMDEDGDRAVEMALADPEKFVLKPQREGGGNNVYGMKIREVLTEIKNSKDREGYILMDRIVPPVQKNYVVRADRKAKLEDVVSELGIFGTIVGSKDKIYENKYAGHMLRTKLSHVDEGGVSHGAGALDSIYLV